MLSPPNPSSPSLQALFLHLIRFFRAQFLHFSSARFPSHPRGRQEVQAGFSKPMGMEGTSLARGRLAERGGEAPSSLAEVFTQTVVNG